MILLIFIITTFFSVYLLFVSNEDDGDILEFPPDQKDEFAQSPTALNNTDQCLHQPEHSLSEISSSNLLLDAIANIQLNALSEDEVDFDFDTCQMSNCFDFTRCRNSYNPLKIHIKRSQEPLNSNASRPEQGESNLIHKHILEIIRNSIHYEPDEEKTCIFVLEEDTLDRDPLSRSFIPNLGKLFHRGNLFGMNHLVFNLYSGTWPDYKANDFAGIQIGAALLAKASNSELFHRSRFDISLPLFSYQHPVTNNVSGESLSLESDTRVEHENKSFFLTFKGKRYVYGSGSDTRNQLYHIDNQRDVIMLTTCRHGKKWRESSDARCSEDESNYNRYEFVDLMKESTFCLTPRGRRLGSFRFLEAMSYGCVPVILSDGWVNPFEELINWSCATVQFEEKQLVLVPDTLRDIPRQSVTQMRGNAKFLYNKYFASMDKIIMSTIAIIEERLKRHFE